MSLYSVVPQLTKMLENLDKWLTKGDEHAKAKSFDPNVLCAARLAPDQYALTRQVQAACDAAKFAAARVSGKTPPAHPDTETTMAELHARVRTVVEYLGTFRKEDFEGAEARVVGLNFMPGKGMKAEDYLTEMAVPNFYFHCNMAYAILRHNGVPVGKIDYIGNVNLQDM
ncbi:MAG: DUF1993 domain-containing protein [Polyangiaceae bacterium]